MENTIEMAQWKAAAVCLKADDIQQTADHHVCQLEMLLEAGAVNNPETRELVNAMIEVFQEVIDGQMGSVEIAETWL